MGYHSGLNGEYNIPVEVSEKKVHKFKKCCKEELPESALKIETYLKDDTIYFVLPNNYKPVKIAFDVTEEDKEYVYGGKGNKKLNVNIDLTDPRSSGYYYKDNSATICDCIESKGGSGATNAIYNMIDDGVYNPNLKYQVGPSSIQYDTINENLDAYEDAIKSLYREINKAFAEGQVPPHLPGVIF